MRKSTAAIIITAISIAVIIPVTAAVIISDGHAPETEEPPAYKTAAFPSSGNMYIESEVTFLRDGDVALICYDSSESAKFDEACATLRDLGYSYSGLPHLIGSRNNPLICQTLVRQKTGF